MRWKLILITSSAISLISFGLQLLLLRFVFGCPLYFFVCGQAPNQFSKADFVAFLTLTLPAIASFSVYRHTARRRKTQAFLTFIFSILLTTILYFIYSIVVLRSIAVYSLFNPILS